MRSILALAVAAALLVTPSAAVAKGSSPPPNREQARETVLRLARQQCAKDTRCIGVVVSRPTRCWHVPGGWGCRMVFRMVLSPTARASCGGTMSIVAKRRVGALVPPLCTP